MDRETNASISGRSPRSRNCKTASLYLWQKTSYCRSFASLQSISEDPKTLYLELNMVREPSLVPRPPHSTHSPAQPHSLPGDSCALSHHPRPRWSSVLISHVSEGEWGGISPLRSRVDRWSSCRLVLPTASTHTRRRKRLFWPSYLASCLLWATSSPATHLSLEEGPSTQRKQGDNHDILLLRSRSMTSHSSMVCLQRKSRLSRDAAENEGRFRGDYCVWEVVGAALLLCCVSLSWCCFHCVSSMASKTCSVGSYAV